MATQSNILAWEIPWTEEPGGLKSTDSQRVRHDRASTHTMNTVGNMTSLSVSISPNIPQSKSCLLHPAHKHEPRSQPRQSERGLLVT